MDEIGLKYGKETLHFAEELGFNKGFKKANAENKATIDKLEAENVELRERLREGNNDIGCELTAVKAENAELKKQGVGSSCWEVDELAR